MSDIQDRLDVYGGWLRIIFGVVACLLPVLVWLCGLLTTPICPSISAYYYTNARDLLEGLLFWASLSLIIFSTVLKCLKKGSDWLIFVSSIFLLSVAIFPCKEGGDIPYIGIFMLPENTSDVIHGIVAVSFFVSMLISCWLFLKETPTVILKVFYSTGLGVCFLNVARNVGDISSVGIPKDLEEILFPWIFIIEFAGLLIIGICWIIKGKEEIKKC